MVTNNIGMNPEEWLISQAAKQQGYNHLHWVMDKKGVISLKSLENRNKTNINDTFTDVLREMNNQLKADISKPVKEHQYKVIHLRELKLNVEDCLYHYKKMNLGFFGSIKRFFATFVLDNSVSKLNKTIQVLTNLKEIEEYRDYIAKRAQAEKPKKAPEETEKKAQETQKKGSEETEKKAPEETAQKAPNESERKAQEEAARKFQEEHTKAEAKRGLEEATQKVRVAASKFKELANTTQKSIEEAAQKAQEETARKAQEEAARKAQEASRKAQEEAARKAQEEATRRAQEQAARRAQEEAARRAQEEAARKAQEEANRRAQEEAARRAQEEVARKAQEEATRRGQEESARRIQEEAARRAQEIQVLYGAVQEKTQQANAAATVSTSTQTSPDLQANLKELAQGLNGLFGLLQNVAAEKKMNMPFTLPDMSALMDTNSANQDNYAINELTKNLWETARKHMTYEYWDGRGNKYTADGADRMPTLDSLKQSVVHSLNLRGLQAQNVYKEAMQELSEDLKDWAMSLKIYLLVTGGSYTTTRKGRGEAMPELAYFIQKRLQLSNITIKPSADLR